MTSSAESNIFLTKIFQVLEGHTIIWRTTGRPHNGRNFRSFNFPVSRRKFCLLFEAILCFFLSLKSSLTELLGMFDVSRRFKSEKALWAALSCKQARHSFDRTNNKEGAGEIVRARARYVKWKRAEGGIFTWSELFLSNLSFFRELILVKISINLF